MTFPDCASCGHLATEHHMSWLPGGTPLITECEDWDSTPPCQCPRYRRSPDRT